MLVKSYLALATALLLGYGATGLLGWEYGSADKQKLPDNVRKQPGGYRTFHYWHSSHRGGK